MSLVTTHTEGRVRIIPLNRPEARNALSAALREALVAALAEAEADASIGAIVLTGAGKCFAAGADLQELQARSSEEQRTFLQPPHMYSVIEAGSKPVIAAVNGHALGAGLELATACDMRIAGTHAKMGQPEIHLAIIPGGGGTQRLVRLIGKGHASKLVLTGDAITADEALRIGLVDEVDEEPLARAIEIANAMARHDPTALRLAKAALHAATTQDYATGLATEIGHFVTLHDRPESRDKVRAFLER